MGRPSHFVASTKRVTDKDMQEYVLWHAKHGKVLDLYVIDREHVLRWLEKHRPYLNRNGDIVSSPREERAGAADIVVGADNVPHDSHIKLYYQERTAAILSKRDRVSPPLNIEAVTRKANAMPSVNREIITPKRGGNGGKPKGPRGILNQSLKNAIDGLKNGKALDVEALTKLVNKAAGK